MRISSIIGPPLVDFYPPALMTPIPGLTIRRFFDNGPLLICFSVDCHNEGLAETQIAILVGLDGIAVATFRDIRFVKPAYTAGLNAANIIPITQGQHTLELLAYCETPPNIYITSDSSRFSVIQLPSWDITKPQST